MKKGFTLAEVLITLGVIGIVAAMTLPSIMHKYKTKEAEARLKKFYSSISQAILLSELENGPSLDWDKTYLVRDADGNFDDEANKNLVLAFFNKYLAPYLKYDRVDDVTKDGLTYIRVMLWDGSLMDMKNGSCSDIHFDVNGLSKPNKFGYDQFVFLLCPRDRTATHCGVGRSFCAYSPVAFPTREKAHKACKETNPSHCGQLLMYDNFEFKDDYPYKL